MCDLKNQQKKPTAVPIKLIHTIIKILRHMEMNVSLNEILVFMLLNHRRSNLTRDGGSRFDPLHAFGSKQFLGLVQVVVVLTIQLCCQVLHYIRGRNEP